MRYELAPNFIVSDYGNGFGIHSDWKFVERELSEGVRPIIDLELGSADYPPQTFIGLFSLLM